MVRNMGIYTLFVMLLARHLSPCKPGRMLSWRGLMPSLRDLVGTDIDLEFQFQGVSCC